MGRLKGERQPETFGREEDLAALLARGITSYEAASLLGLSLDGLYTWCRRNGYMDVYNAFPKRPRGRREKTSYGGAW